jgi:hypothetical protein
MSLERKALYLRIKEARIELLEAELKSKQDRIELLEAELKSKDSKEARNEEMEARRPPSEAGRRGHCWHHFQ